ncbi:SDR family NAD(P)-dependent oxidoreductase [Caballeronia sp. LjRoot29]|jgi:NADP-dependent 3-hydroxy acid dehydrogenase YdfG|uniref:SDR family oxidoreductase n=1 Tax=Caballeronia sp. LjRoot29 TaxID=3342315 RepID=UPI003ECC22D2
MSDQINGKVIVITGASSGLGLAAARLLSARGACVVLGARRIERLQQLADELNRTGRRALGVATDVTVLDDVKRLVDTAVQTFGRIDVMINDAGLMPLSLLGRLKVDDWVESFARAVAFAIDQPDDMDVNKILFRPTRQVS